MKVLQINKYFYRKGGADTVFFNTMRMLEERGHEVVPFALRNEKNLRSDYEQYFVPYPELGESSLGEKVRRAPSFVYNRRAAAMLEKLLKAERPDIAHVHLMFNSLSVSILPVLRKYGIPVVMTVHDYRLICPAYLFTDGNGRICERCKTGNYYNCILRRCSKGRLFNSLMLASDSYFRRYIIKPIDYVDRFIFVSRFAMEKHIEFSAKYAGKSEVLPNFTPLLPCAAVAKGDYCLYIGRISEEKGIPTLVEAVKGSGIQLRVAGTGPLLESLRRQSPPNVEFTGHKSGDELYDYIRRARFVVVPSECYENNPMSVIEAMTLGTPVIGSRIGGIPELIEDGLNGYLFEPGSPRDLRLTLDKALSMPADKYDTLRREAQTFARANFGEEAYYRKLITLYNNTILNYNE
ncbi:MAG: glycosyltransferase [Tannerellaceae bacterium]|jgi:glycosyltransferase involved in cell wall biosynthesis|nr:glycosyltransferase [Tannerellaceae bacterium]